jgi:hypothetical protein
MKTVLFKGCAIFFVLLVATSVMMDTLQTEFGRVDFFQKHGLFFLVFVTLFPRLTLLFSSVATGGLFWWLGFFFCPRILVASLATVAYFHTNPVLVTISWVVALGGETMEKAGLGKRRGTFVFRTYRNGGPRPFASPAEEAQTAHRHNSLGGKDDAIEAEFTKKG